MNSSDIATLTDAVQAQLLDEQRNIFALEAALAAAKTKYSNTLFMLVDEAARGELRGAVPRATGPTSIGTNDPSHPLRRASAAAKKPAKKRARQLEIPGANGASTTYSDTRAKPGRKPSQDSAAAKVLRAMGQAKADGKTDYKTEELVALTGLDTKRVQSAIGALRHQEKISAVARGLYRITG